MQDSTHPLLRPAPVPFVAPSVPVPRGAALVRARTTLEIALSGITANKARTLLTLLGIVIGVASVITAVGIGTGSQAQVTSQLNNLGTNLLTVQPGSSSSGGIRGGVGSASTLTLSDAQAMANEANPNGLLPDVLSVAPEDTTQVQVVAGKNNTSTTADGATPEVLLARDYTVGSGRFITADDIQHSAQVADLGATLASTLFPDDPNSAIGGTILLNGQGYQVIGLMVLKGGFGGVDNDVIVPLTAVENRLSLRAGAARAVTSINVVATEPTTTDAAQAEVTSLLRRLHKLTAAQLSDFSFFSQTSIQQTASNVTGTLTLLLGAISAVSLVVGGIGIMNIMLVTVTERTREIGLRKALGARKSDILAQFLVESTLISALGGLLGVLFSYIVAWILPQLTAGNTGFASAKPVITNGSVILAVGVSLMIGLFFGSYPASRAAALDPIQALRYE